MSTFAETALPLDQLLLDPNNFRFQDSTDFVYADPKRFSEPTVQSKASERLRGEALLPLKNSILKNGFVTIERIVVAKHSEGKYIVVEGNRRVAALRWIQSDHSAGTDIPKRVIDVLNAVPVVIVPDDSDDAALRESLMGIRHVSGIKEWGGYQRAQLVATLKDKHKLESGDIAQRLGMTTNEVNRRYRAFKALRQMMENEEFGDAASPKMYPMFHEAVSLPAVRDWLGWHEETTTFTKADELNQFYELISPRETGEGEDPTEPKITSYSQVRDLRPILDNTEARKILLDPTRSFVEAVAVGKSQEMAGSWKAEIIEALTALKSIGVLELKKAAPEDVQLLTDLRDTAGELLTDLEKLKKD